ncbi:MAG: hypothetical protein DMG57_43080 [Acidobacteria bacterium]|nr:MAG: hypothetical protein DMG57_43080 [Acidobacteriota bacterium]
MRDFESVLDDTRGSCKRLSSSVSAHTTALHNRKSPHDGHNFGHSQVIFWWLYRAADTKGKTIDFYLSRTRDKKAATAFFRKAMKHHGEPRTITLNGFEPSHCALRCMGMRNEFNYR